MLFQMKRLLETDYGIDFVVTYTASRSFNAFGCYFSENFKLFSVHLHLLIIIDEYLRLNDYIRLITDSHH
jgi:hypothetical protein